jgi:serine/threonine protein kinase
MHACVFLTTTTGTWANQVVAVKVMEHTSGQGSNDYMLEGLLSQQMMHPHIVRTYRYVTRPLQLPVEPSGSWAAGAGSATGPSSLLDGKSSSTPLLETWLVLEFCNRGCVVDAVSKGWFRAALPTPATAVNDADRGGQAASGAGQQQQQHMLDIGAVLATAREIASALAHLHGHNILHGDLTGSNVLLTSAQGDARGFTAKVSDFGLSCLINMDAPVIETSTYGTVTHMPPELLCEGRMSKAVDVYR